MMVETRTFNLQEFAQFAADRIARLENRLQGMHTVMNGFANEIRNTDPAMASRIAAFISTMAEQQDASGDTKEIVDMYVGILTHEFRDPSELQ